MARNDPRDSSPRRRRLSRRPRAARVSCRFEALEERVLLTAQYLDHLSSDLVALYDARSLPTNSAVGVPVSSGIQQSTTQFDAQGRVGVTVTAVDVNTVVAAMESSYGFVLSASVPADHEATGYMPVSQLEAATSLVPDGLLGIVANYEPITQSYTQPGTFNDQAVNVLEADRVGATPNTPALTGAGVTIGVLSDSFNAKGQAATDEADGDLPATVDVLQDDPLAGGTDEGRAMLQLAHHVAPGAAEDFATGAFGGDAGMASNIHALANAGAKVIADDIAYPDEPFFQDGIIAQAVDSVVTNQGVSYFTSADNYNGQGYLTTSPAFAAGNVPGVGAGTFLNFTPGGGTNLVQGLTLTAGQQARLTLEWDSPFYTTSGVTTNLNFYIVDPTTDTIVASSTTDTTATQQPFQYLSFANSGTSTATYDLVIALAKGAAPGAVKWQNFDSNEYGDIAIQYADNAPTMNPHGAAVDAMAVAAAPYFDQTTPEPSSSEGPVLIDFDAQGNRLATPVTRAKPDIMSIDGVDNTVLGTDYEGDGHPNFFGTSAATPNAAGVAALMLQANPSLTPAQLYAQMKATATPVAAGADAAGAGLLDAYRAIYAAPVAASLPFSDGFETGAATQPWQVYKSGNGEVDVTSAAGPDSGSYQLALDTLIDIYPGYYSTIPALDEAVLNVNAANETNVVVNYDLKAVNPNDFAAAAPMPASFTGHGDYDGVSFSVDGGNTWYRLQNVDITQASFQTYAAYAFNLSQAAQALGLSLTADTQIKFQHDTTDTFNITHEGIAIDNVSVTGTPMNVPTTTSLTLSDNPSVYGDTETVWFTAAVSPPEATGTVTFYDGTTALGTVTLSGGSATYYVTSPLAVGQHKITAVYGGDGTYLGSTSTPQFETVDRDDTSTAVTSSANASAAGQPVTFTATVTPDGGSVGTPTGTVIFYDGTTALDIGTLSGGVATYTTSALAAGAHAITATYSGDTDFAAGTPGTLTQQVLASYHLRTLAAFNGTDGSGSFDGLVMDGQGDLFGTTYSGGADDVGTVFEIASGSNAITWYASFNLATTGGHPEGGSLVFDGQGDLFGTTFTGGPAGYGTVFEVARGSHTITPIVVFDNSNGANPAGGLVFDGRGDLYGTTANGSGNYGTVFEVPSGTTAAMTVATFTLANAGPGGNLVFDGQGDLYGTTSTGYSGTVFEIARGTNVVATVASFGVPGQGGLEPGNLVIDSQGDLFGTIAGDYGASSYGSVFEIARGTNAPVTLASFNGLDGNFPDGLTIDGRGDLYGTTAEGGASNYGTVFEIAQGTNAPVTLASFNGLDGAFPGAGVVLDGQGDLYGTTEAGGPGFNYPGQEENGTVFEMSVTQPTSVALASSTAAPVYGQPVTFTATVSPSTATGTVTFFDGTTALGTGTVSGGQATYVTNALAVGTHAITASYGGDANDPPSTSAPLSQTVGQDQTTTLVSSSVNPSVYGQPVTFTATVSVNAPGAGTPTGTVTFYDGSNTLGSGTLSGGVATYSTTALAVGTHAITWMYSGDADDAASGGNRFIVVQTVNKDQAVMTIDPSANPSTLGQPVTFTATVAAGPPGTGTPTGTVRFYDGTTTLGTGTLSAAGVATYTTSTLTAGTHSISASYGGDTDFAAGTSSPVSELVAPSYSLRAFAEFNGTNGANPEAGLLRDSQGDLFGTTYGSSAFGKGDSVGSVFEIAAGATSITQYAAFNYSVNGGDPIAGLVMDGQGDLFGVTSLGPNGGPGQVFEIVKGTFAIAPIATVGTFPDGNLIFDGQGNLYGTTLAGGPNFDGTVFMIPKGTHTVQTVATFDGTNGLDPDSNLVFDSQGNLFGTTTGNGGSGTVFEVPRGTNTAVTVATFAPGEAAGNLVMDGQGDLFGTTGGTIFEIARGTTTPVTMANADAASLTIDSQGDLFGTTAWDGSYGSGTVFEIAQGSSNVTTLFSFNGTDGQAPFGPLVIDSQGDLFGTTLFGGQGYNGAPGTGDGTVFELTTSAPSISSLSLASSTTTPVYGQPVTLTATVSPATAVGTVTFIDGTTVLGMATLSGGVATLQSSALTAGAHVIAAVYGGDADDSGATAIPLLLTVAADATTTAVSSSANPVEANQPVSFTATVTPAAPGQVTPTGSVQFKVDGKPLGAPVALSGGVAVSPATSTLAAGPHTVTATFVDPSGDFATSTGTLTGQKVLAYTATSLGASTTAPVYGQPVTFTATVTNLDTANAVTGSVSFYDGTRAIGAAAVSGGRAVLTIANLAAGTTPHSITATYNGSSTLAPSTSGAAAVTVSQASTTVALSDSAAGPISYGTPLTVTATVAGVGTPAVPTGAVRFYSGATLVGAATLSGGKAGDTITLPAGDPDALTAVYVGTGNFAGGTSAAVDQEVDPAQTSTSLNLSTGSTTYGRPVTFTATVTSTSTAAAPTGVVRFYNGPTLLGSAAVGAGGIATLTRSTLTGGSYAVSASYAGTADFAASASAGTVPLTVSPAATGATLTSSTGSTTYGQPVTFTVSVTNAQTAPVPTGGTVSFYLDYAPPAASGLVATAGGGALLGSAALINGTATFTTRPNALPGGSHTVTAIYNGTANFQATTSNPVGQTISPANTSTALASSASGDVTYGTAVTFTATVTDTDTGLVPTGMAEFFDGTTLLATVGVSAQGKATLVKSLGHGSHSITATFEATTNDNASTSNAIGLTVS